MRALVTNQSSGVTPRECLRSRWSYGLLALSLVIVVPAVCSAQGGVRAGDFEFKPLVSITGEYDSNFWRESEQDFTKPVNPVYVLRLRGGLEGQNRTPNKVSIQGKTSLGLRNASGDDVGVTS